VLTGQQPNLVVFPGAGSFGGEFQPLLRALGPAAVLARYPGRFGPDLGVGADSFDAVVRACAEQVRRRPAAPVLVGYSFGAYVAYATAARLRAEDVEVGALVAVAATGPATIAVPESARRGPIGTAAYLEAATPGSLSAAVGDWRELVIEAARTDLVLLEEFRVAAHPRLAAPIFAAHGEHDGLTAPAGVAGWAARTSGPFRHRVFPGGHADLLGSVEFHAWLRREVLTPAQP
jgi:surfactin synthase thioesterase subunit